MSLSTWALATALAAGVPTAGPQVGEAFAPFALRDQAGSERSFENLKGPNGLVLILFRSADW